MNATRRRVALIALCVVPALAVLPLLSSAIIGLAERPPFLMILEPTGNGATVQFLQADPELLSLKFPVALRPSQRQVITLDSAEVSIPGGTITFADTTILPGRFTIDIRGRQFDIMSRAVIVDGQESNWKQP